MTEGPSGAAQGEACCVCGATEARAWRVAPDNLLGGTELFTAVRCVRCRMVRLQPRPSVEAMNKYYTPTTYARAEENGDGDAGTPELAKRLDEFFRRQAARAMTAVGNGASAGGRRLLDVGCGDGRFLAAMAARGWSGEGIETEPAAARLARRRTGSVIYETPLEETSEIVSGSFDMVSLLHVLEHVPDPRATLTQAFTALRPGGTLLLALPNVACAEANLFRTFWYPLDLPRHYWGFSPRILVRLVEECGFKVAGLRYLPFLFAPQSLRYALRALLRRGRSPAAAPPATATEPGRDRDSARRTRLFLTLLRLSETMGRALPGEVMELTARRPAAEGAATGRG